MDRDEALTRIRGADGPWDLVVVGGGASGLGVAVDAASRGYRTLLLEGRDFGAGTSSRSTKLIHGGVRYLRAGHLGLVRSSLRERTILLRNAPHLVTEIPFVVPGYRRRDVAWIRLGLALYDGLAGSGVRTPSRGLTVAETKRLLPGVRTAGLCGGVCYVDGRFDDARLAVSLARTAWREGATVINHFEVVGLAGRAGDVHVHGFDRESGEAFEIAARVVVNAAGPFVDAVRRLANPSAAPLLRPSRGTHRVLPGDAALLVPDVGDGRVVFLVPWRGCVLLGTTDVAVAEATEEPRGTRAEAEELLALAARVLETAPTPADVRSVFAGLRPLVAHPGRTASLPRDHEVRVEEPGLVTLAGGKWTTYRRMAVDAVDRAATVGGLPRRGSITGTLRLDDAIAPGGGAALAPGFDLAEADVAWAARAEMARTVEDVLARRTAALVTDARAAREAAPVVARALAAALGRDAAWESGQVAAFTALAAGREFAGLA